VNGFTRLHLHEEGIKAPLCHSSLQSVPQSGILGRPHTHAQAFGQVNKEAKKERHLFRPLFAVGHLCRKMKSVHSFEQKERCKLAATDTQRSPLSLESKVTRENPRHYRSFSECDFQEPPFVVCTKQTFHYYYFFMSPVRASHENAGVILKDRATNITQNKFKLVRIIEAGAFGTKKYLITTG
jgi:hypothetical protein